MKRFNFVRLISCGHYFHKSCFQKGLDSNENGFSCPLCLKKQNILRFCLEFQFEIRIVLFFIHEIFHYDIKRRKKNDNKLGKKKYLIKFP